MADAYEYAGPWHCFHCGLVCETRQEAEDHFGYDESEMPGCIVAITETQKAIIEDRRDWRRRALAAEDDAEQARYAEGLLRFDLGSRFKGAKSLNDAWNMYETLEGKYLSVLERVTWVPAWVRKLFLPKGYFDLNTDDILGAAGARKLSEITRRHKEFDTRVIAAIENLGYKVTSVQFNDTQGPRVWTLHLEDVSFSGYIPVDIDIGRNEERRVYDGLEAITPRPPGWIILTASLNMPADREVALRKAVQSVKNPPTKGAR